MRRGNRTNLEKESIKAEIPVTSRSFGAIPLEISISCVRHLRSKAGPRLFEKRRKADVVDIISELQKKTAYRSAFERLRKRAVSEPRLRRTAPIEKSLTLSWVLENESLVTRELISIAKNQLLVTQSARAHDIYLDKLRTICSQPWPLRILQAAAVEHMAAALPADVFSPKLFSFRTGYGQFRAISELGNHIANAFAAENRSGTLFVCQRDIRQYDRAIRPETLLAIYEAKLPPQSEFFWKLLKTFLTPEIENATEAWCGIPMGYHVTPLSENLYLADFDKQFDCAPGLYYQRYGDDLVFAHTDPEALKQIMSEVESQLRELGLEFNSEKNRNSMLSPQDASFRAPDGFKGCTSIEYLGMQIDTRGASFLTAKKLAALKKTIRSCVDVSYAMHLKYGGTEQEQLQAVINSLRVLLEPELRPPYLELIISSANNIEKIRDFDVWFAKQALRVIYGNAHDKVFRRVSLSRLREMGLPSILHLRQARFRL